MTPGGELYGFCPGKITREPTVHAVFRILMIAAETGAMLKAGGIEDQPDWFVELLGWFIPRLDSLRFTVKAGMILGNDSAKSQHQAMVSKVLGGKRGGNNRQPAR